MSKILKKKIVPVVDIAVNAEVNDEEVIKSSVILDNIINSVIANIEINYDKDNKEAEVEEEVEVPEPVVEEKKLNFMFISDRNVCDEVKKQLSNYTNLRVYDQNFINRKPEDLIENGIEHVWLDVRNNKCREWLKFNLKSTVFKKVLVYSSNKRSKFLDDLKEYVDVECKLENLNKLNSLSLGELVQKIEDYVDIHDVPNRCLSFLGCGSSLIKKKPKN